MWRLRPEHCSDDTLVALADGELAHHAQTVALQHTAVCPRCAGVVRRQTEANAAIIDLLATDHPPPVSVMSVGRHRRRAVTGAGLLVASFGAVVAAGIAVRRRRGHAPVALNNVRA